MHKCDVSYKTLGFSRHFQIFEKNLNIEKNENFCKKRKIFDKNENF